MHVFRSAGRSPSRPGIPIRTGVFFGVARAWARVAQLRREDSQPPGQSGLLSQGVRSPAPRIWSPRGESGDLTATARGQSWKSHSSHPGICLGVSCGAGIPLASREPRPVPENASWAPLR